MWPEAQKHAFHHHLSAKRAKDAWLKWTTTHPLQKYHTNGWHRQACDAGVFLSNMPRIVSHAKNFSTLRKAACGHKHTPCLFMSMSASRSSFSLSLRWIIQGKSWKHFFPWGTVRRLVFLPFWLDQSLWRQFQSRPCRSPSQHCMGPPSFLRYPFFGVVTVRNSWDSKDRFETYGDWSFASVSKKCAPTRP